MEYLAMEEVGDTCCTHGAVVCQICHSGVRHRLELIRPIVSKVFCSWNQVDELSASLQTQHAHTQLLNDSTGGECSNTRAWDVKASLRIATVAWESTASCI